MHWPSRSSTAIWAGSSATRSRSRPAAEGGRAGRRPRPARHAHRAGPARRRHHRRGHGRRRRRVLRPVAPGGARHRAAGRPADGADRAGRAGLPPGELWGSTFQHRFRGEGALAGHPVGNIVLVGLGQVLGDPVAALDAAGAIWVPAAGCCRCPASRWTSSPRSQGLDEDPSARAADPRSGCRRHHPGPGPQRRPRTGRRDRPARRRSPRSHEADLITFGPGSWFTSVLPHLLLPDMAAAITGSSREPAGGAEPGRATGGDRGILAGAAPGRTLSTRPEPSGRLRARGPCLGGAAAASAVGRAAAGGAVLDLHDVAVPGTARHDPIKLSVSLAEVLGRSPAGGERVGLSG